jgi:exopolyphosphatase/guanosine-5'-triphosphate,3'-diphosphate pyrophosphatase
MENGDALLTPASTSRTVAAIDVGANAVRMVIAQVAPDGSLDVLERLQRAARLGQDTFRRGRLGAQSMRAAAAILRDYRQMLQVYHVERIRAVATSAVREADNAENFLNRVFMATGLNVEVIATSEESRLTVSAVLRAVGDAMGVNAGYSLVVEAGGGSTLLTMLHDGQILTSQSLRLGAIRMREMLTSGDEPPDRSAELLRSHVANAVSTIDGSLQLRKATSLIAVGGDARFAGREVGAPGETPDLYTVAAADLDKLVARCRRRSAEELAKRHGLPFAEAETIVPALLVYQQLLGKVQTKTMIVSQASMRDGLLLELARHVTGEEDKSLTDGVFHSAMALGEKFGVDLQHAEDVTAISLKLFDVLQADHRLGPRQRLLLRTAGLLHEAGAFVSNVAHHKHSCYLIANSEIFGLNRDEIAIVAHIARYHRRSGPKPSHLEYMVLPRESRIVINKLAAILRVGDSLSRKRGHPLAGVRFQRNGDEMILLVSGGGDLGLERRAIAAKGDMFEDVYGMSLRVEEA